MLKKNVWVAGLLAALVIIFFGCVEALPPPEGEVVEVVNLQTIIADAPDGVIEGDTGWDAIFGKTPFQKCGNPQFTIITDGGVKKLKVDNMVNGWGEGLDLYNLDNADKNIVGIDAGAGDILIIKGTINPVGNGLKMSNGGGKAKFEQWTSGAEFDKEYKLIAANIGEIRGASPQAIRLSYSDPDGDARKGTIIFEQIIFKKVITGARDVYDTDFEVTNFVYQKDWVNGVTITPKKGKSAGNITTYYESAANPAYAKSTVIPQATGTYKVTFDVAEELDKNGKPKFKATSDLSGGSMYVFDALPSGDLEIELKNGEWEETDKTKPGFIRSVGIANIDVMGPAGKKLIFLTGNNLTIPAGLLPSAIGAAGFTEGKTISTAASADFAYPRLIFFFGSDPSWKAYKEVRFTYDLYKTTVSDNQLQVNIRGNKSDTGYSNGGDLSEEKNDALVSGNTYTFTEGIGNTITFPIKEITKLDAANNGISFQKNTDGSAFLIKFTKVELITY